MTGAPSALDRYLGELARPPTYCWVSCRRAAEREVRRATRRLERLEDEEMQLRRQLDDVDDFYGERRHLRRKHRWVTAEIERLEGRLRLLFGAQTDDPSGPESRRRRPRLI
jgi:hypothetical protein